MKTSIEIQVAVGELIDKITILRIKAAQITQPQKLKNIQHELDGLLAKQAKLPVVSGLQELQKSLQTANEKLWKIEDDIRDCESQKQFGEQFVQLARSVYITNDLRCQIKRKINQLFDSEIIEEKSYTAYQ
jgi:hypothetical protein